jgi:hypothetical protein
MSTNHKDIDILYLCFAFFFDLLDTAVYFLDSR